MTQEPLEETPSDMVELRKEQAYRAAPSRPLSSEEAPMTGRDLLEKSPQPQGIRQPPRDSIESPATQQPLYGSKVGRSATTTQFPPSQNRGYINEHLQSGRQSSLSFSTTRPMSAPTVGVDLHISQWIPPKRELPFPKPKEPKKALDTIQKPKKGSENGPILQSKSTSASDKVANKTALPSKHGEQQIKRVVRRTNTPPTSKLSSVVEVPDSDEETRPTNERRNSVLWEEEPPPLASKSAAIARPSTAPGLKSKAMASRKRSNEATPKWALAKRVKMVNSSTQTQTLSGRDHTAAMSRASTLTTEPVVSVPVTVPAPVTAPPTAPNPTITVPVPGPGPVPPTPEVISEAKGPIEGFLDELGHFVAKYGGKSKPVELWEVPGWNGATEGERHSMTETWICEQLEDPSFLELCKHVDSVWEKIRFKT